MARGDRPSVLVEVLTTGYRALTENQSLDTTNNPKTPIDQSAMYSISVYLFPRLSYSGLFECLLRSPSLRHRDPAANT